MDGSLIEKIKEIGKNELPFHLRNNQRQGSYTYINVCWNCHAGIDSDVQKRCPVCKMFICSSCGSCFCNRYKN